MRTHGISEIHRNTDAVDVLVEEVRDMGFAVLPDALDEGRLAAARELIDAIYERQVEEIGGVDRLQLIGEADVARNLVEYDDLFVEVAANPGPLEVVRRLLGDYVVLMSQNGIINRPGDHYQHAWHRDLQYRHFTSSRPLGVSVLYCIDEFSVASGGTHLLPGSHRREDFPSPEFVERHEVLVEAPAGAALVFDAMVFHRAGVNTSGEVRRAVNHIFTVPLIQQQISLPTALNGRFADDPRLRQLLGYEAPPEANALAWRRTRLRRAGATAQANGSSRR